MKCIGENIITPAIEARGFAQTDRLKLSAFKGNV
jgi:hypothetical protein